MSLAPGTRLGAYEVVGLIGAGGMGEVYRARDTRLKRDVALKILPESFAADPERLARFEREAQVLASLNHPNIAAIHGLEESSGIRALVLELVEGETLADRIARGPIPLPEALPIARQIAEALEAAHEHGIIHRDLKPANIKLTGEGHVKVLDFGLAKALSDDAAAGDVSTSPTMTAVATRAGVILGTAAYMSPEQIRGKTIDKRVDIWAFGCVFYEMLSGTRAFAGDEVSDVLASVLAREPDLTALSADTPPAIRRLLRRCLQKDRTRRFADIVDARLDIEEAQGAPQTDVPVAIHASTRKERLAWISALALVTLIAAVLGVWTLRPVPPAPEIRLEITTPPTTDAVSLAISPDGQKIVFVATFEDRSRLWLRSLDSVSARPLVPTDGASFPFWSPDSRSVGFFADGKLKRIDIDVGPAQTLANATTGSGGTWNRDGTIVFAPTVPSGLFRISATGGEPAPLTRGDAPQLRLHRFPQFLPDGQHFLFYVMAGVAGDDPGVYIGHIEGSQTKRLLAADAAAVYASTGHLLFVRQGTLFAQDFDPVGLELTGNPVPVAEELAVDPVFTLAAISASAAGPIVYRAATAGGQRQFVWFDRAGKEIGKVGDPDSAARLNPSLSPNARHVAMDRRVNENGDIWLLETAQGVLSRFTFDAAGDSFPIWSPDGRRIVFQSNRKGVQDLYVKPATGAGSEELLLATPQIKVPTDWSPDGRFLLFRSLDPNTSYDIWALPLDGDRKPFLVVRTNFEDRDAQFSPDGKWIAYQSNESGRHEIYVQRFPSPGGKWQMSSNGGAQVRWRPDGRELFYIALDDRLMAVPLRFTPDGQAVEAGAPVPLFLTRVGGAVRGRYTQQYMVSPDGQRFLMNTVTEEATAPITVILNWKARP